MMYGMYGLVTKGCIAVAMVVGIVMLIAPKKVGKKSLTETKKGTMVVRIFGALIIVCGLIGLLAISWLNSL